METTICGVTFKKVDDETIAVYNSMGAFHKNINYPATSEEEFVNSANFYYAHCY